MQRAHALRHRAARPFVAAVEGWAMSKLQLHTNANMYITGAGQDVSIPAHNDDQAGGPEGGPGRGEEAGPERGG